MNAPTPEPSQDTSRPWRVEVSDDGDHSEVTLWGELDLSTAPDLRAAFRPLTGRIGMKRVVVDMEGLTFLDSTGISVLIDAVRDLQAHGGAMRVTSAHGSVRRVLEITHVCDILGVD